MERTSHEFTAREKLIKKDLPAEKRIVRYCENSVNITQAYHENEEMLECHILWMAHERTDSLEDFCERCFFELKLEELRGLQDRLVLILFRKKGTYNYDSFKTMEVIQSAAHNLTGGGERDPDLP